MATAKGGPLMAGRYKSIWACLHRCLKIADREDGGLAGFVGGALGGAALLAAHRRLVVLVGVVCGVAGDGVEQGFQFRDTGPQPPDFGDFSAQPREFAIALLATLDVATQLLAEPLDLLAGLPVAGVLCQGLVTVHRSGETLHHSTQLLTHRPFGVAVLEDLQQELALIIRAEKQSVQGVHRRQRQACVGVGSMRVGHLDHAHRGTGIAGSDALGRG